MSKFVLTYTGGNAPQTPAEGEAVMAAWMAWFGELGASVIDGGNPFSDAKTVTADGSIKDGGSSALGGYSIIDAVDLADAVSKAKGCPVLQAGGAVDVYTAMDM
jgi:hypothetical protein